LSFFETDLLKIAGYAGRAFTIPNFVIYEDVFIKKSFSLFSYIWHRGVILIIKKFKFLRKIDQKRGKWSLGGFCADADFFPKEMDEDMAIKKSLLENIDTSTIQLEKDARKCFDDLFNSYFNVDPAQFENTDLLELKDFKDIRENKNYKQFLKLIGRPLNMEINGWKELMKEMKAKIIHSASILMSLQLRKILEDTIYQIRDLFLSVKPLSWKITRKQSSLGTDRDRKSSEDLEVLPSPGSGNAPSLHLANAFQKRKSKYSAVEVISKLKQSTEASILSLAQGPNEIDIKYPDCMKYTNQHFPFLKIHMIVENGQLVMKESQENVKGEIEKIFELVFSTFAKFLHPKFSKIEIETKKSKELKEQKGKEILKNSHIIPFLEGQDAIKKALGLSLQVEKVKEFYEKFCGPIKVTLYKPESKNELLIEKFLKEDKSAQFDPQYCLKVYYLSKIQYI